jgi:hypothetical protein
MVQVLSCGRCEIAFTTLRKHCDQDQHLVLRSEVMV